MNKQQLAAKIWESANEMRSKIDANEYKDYILGFIFYKFLSDKLEENLIKSSLDKEDFKDELTEENIELVQFTQRNFGYFISYNNLFSTWINKGSDFDVSDVRDALSAFDRLIHSSYQKVYKEIFDTLQTGLSNLGSTATEQTKAISKLIHLIKEIPMDGKQDYDVLGFVYEYLISMFAANAGKKAGEFYTPHEVSLLMSDIVAHHLKDNERIEIYDPTSGSGSLLINIGTSVAKHLKDKDNIKYYAQELKKNTYNLTRMNLVMRGIKPSNIITRNADTLEQDWPYIDENNNYDPLYVDAVVSNPPYSQKWDPENKDSDPRYKEYGLAPKSKADYAFLLHDLFQENSKTKSISSRGIEIIKESVEEVKAYVREKLEKIKGAFKPEPTALELEIKSLEDKTDQKINNLTYSIAKNRAEIRNALEKATDIRNQREQLPSYKEEEKQVKEHESMIDRYEHINLQIIYVKRDLKEVEADYKKLKFYEILKEKPLSLKHDELKEKLESLEKKVGNIDINKHKSMKKEIQPKINRIKNKENELYKEEKQAYNKIDRLEQLNKDHEEEIKGLRSLLKERIFELNNPEFIKNIKEEKTSMSERIASAKIKAKEINEEGKEKPNFSIGDLQKNQKEIDRNKKEKLNKEKNKSRGMSR